jgi:deoxycytidylate deaminase
MSTSALSQAQSSASNLAVGPEDTIDRLRKTHTDELVFALCGPIGSPLHLVADRLHSVLTTTFKYQCETILLSKFIEQKGTAIPSGASPFDRVNHLVQEGNNLRARFGRGVLAELGISEIHIRRAEMKIAAKTDRFTAPRFCHIFDSIKNQQELDVLRLVYGDLLFCIGVFSPKDFRVDVLKNKPMRDWEVYKLIDQDSGEEIDHGQTVRNTFPQADFFLKVDSKDSDQISGKVERLLNVITRVKITTPTSHESAMYMAASAGANSACLSRQVGACITDPKGLVLGLGWNEVPKFGGGVYGDEDVARNNDQRCLKLEGGKCYNDFEKTKIAGTIVSALVDSKIIDPNRREEATETVLKSKIKDLLEFSRAVHAELHAIINAAQQTGVQMKGGRLYCTTFPCHPCARHIIASGLADVYYIEPYSKSLATSLHGDAITEDESATSKVRLLPYEGVAPRRFHELYTMRPDSRKVNGMKSEPFPSTTSISSEVSLESFPVLEAFILDGLVEKKLIKKPELESHEASA